MMLAEYEYLDMGNQFDITIQSLVFADISVVQ